MAGGCSNLDTQGGITNYIGRHQQYSAHIPATFSCPPTYSPPASGLCYTKQHIYYVPVYPPILAAPVNPPVSLYIIILRPRTPPLTALLLSCPFPLGLGTRQPFTVGTRCRSCKGPHANKSCQLQGRMPPIAATHGAVCISPKKSSPGISGLTRRASSRPVYPFRHVTSYSSSPHIIHPVDPLQTFASWCAS